MLRELSQTVQLAVKTDKTGKKKGGRKIGGREKKDGHDSEN
jgi:hypothetical protein